MARERKQTITQQIMHDVIATQKERSHDLSRKQYIRDAKRFVKYCREHFDSKTFGDCRTHIQDYSDFMQKSGYKASTIHTYLAGVCAVFGVDLGDISKPIRHVSDYTRGRGGAKSVDNISDSKWSYIVDFQRVVGIRRDELYRLKGKDIETDESGYLCVVVRRGKGGKMQLQRIDGGKENFIAEYFSKVAPDEFVFDRKLFNNDLNFHAIRAECARKYYFEQVQRLGSDPDYARKLESEIRARWERFNLRRNGKVRPIPKNEIRGQYFLRGKTREFAINKGLPTSYNKLALLATSIFKLSHWRNDVTVGSYMLISQN